jgi:hypothetical protein
VSWSLTKVALEAATYRLFRMVVWNHYDLHIALPQCGPDILTMHPHEIATCHRSYVFSNINIR